MISEEKLKQVVGAALEIPPACVNTDTSTDTVTGWDSLKHMRLIIALEEAFDVSIPDEDVLTLTAYPLIKLVLEELVAPR